MLFISGRSLKLSINIKERCFYCKAAVINIQAGKPNSPGIKPLLCFCLDFQLQLFFIRSVYQEDNLIYRFLTNVTDFSAKVHQEVDMISN